jgi:rod shape-determining protein MreB
MIFKKLIKHFSTDLAMDLGTANTLIYIKGEGIVLNEPSIVAISSNGEKIEAVGFEAKQMFGRTHAGFQTIRPMKDGVIADFSITQRMITYFIKKILKNNWLIKPRIIIGVPTCITQVEKKAVIEAALMSGVREVHLIEEPMAAAIGANIPVQKAEGNMVIDIGGGTTDVAITSLSAIAYGESVRVAGDAIDESIVRYLRLQHNLNIGIFEAERVKTEIGSAYPVLDKLSTKVKGLSVQTGVPTSITISGEEIRGAIQDPILTIISIIMKALEKTPPELSADIQSNGIYLTGGGALIRGLDKLVEERTSLKVYKPIEPLLGIVKGAGAVLDSYEEMKTVCIS